MENITKEKIIKINTQQAGKNIKSLRQQIKELREQMAQLEKGTEQYNAAAVELANLNQKQIEINESMKYSNKDLGASLSNLTNVAAGVMGAINGINSVMVMMGADSEEAAEALKNIQLTMALIQGMSAIDTARKSLEGLVNTFKGLANAENIVTTETLAQAERDLAAAQAGVAGSTNLETAAMNENTAAKLANGAAGKTVGADGVKNVGKVTKGFGNLTKVIKGIGVALTGTLGIVLGIGAAIAATVVIASKLYAKAHEEAKKRREEEILINAEYDKQMVEMESLVAAFKDQNTSQEQKKALAKQINDLAKDEVVTQNEVTGELTLQTDKLNEYKENLKTTILLELRRKQILELMEKEEEARKNANKEANSLIGNLFRTEKGYLKDAEEYNKQWNDILKETANLTAQVAENTQKAANYTNSTKTGGIVKSFKELLKTIKEIYSQAVDNIFQEREFKKIFNGVYDEADILAKNIERLIKTNDVGDLISDTFKAKLEGDVYPLIENYEVTLDNIFKDFDNGEKYAKGIEGFEQRLIDKEQELAKLIKEKKSLRDKDVEKQREAVERMKYQLTAMKDIAEAAHKYADYIDKVKERGKEINRLQEDNIVYADTEVQNRKTKLTELGSEKVAVQKAASAYNELSRKMQEAQAEYDELSEKINGKDGLQNKKILERYNELFDYIQQGQKDLTDAEMSMEDAKYQYRLAQLKKYFEKQDKLVKADQDQLETNRTNGGLGTADYNLDRDLLQIEIDNLKERAKYVEFFYDVMLANATAGSTKYKLIEAEKEAALTDLAREGDEKREEIAQAEAERKIAIHEAYVNAYQNISGQIQSLLSAEMEQYDENSKQYKNLQYANGVIDTLSGTLSAFMSGIQSGLPAPANAILATAMAGLTFATGLAQLRNLQNETLSNAATGAATSYNFGEYDTLAYAQNNEILGSIQDSRVYVVESDITTTQNRVRVRENNTSF